LPVSKPIYAIGVKESDLPSTPEERLRRHFVRSMLDEILFSRSGSFYNDLFERGILTPSFSTGSTSGDGFSFFTLEGEADDPERVFSELVLYLERVKREGISDDDFERARRVLYADEICGYDSTEEIAGRLLPFAFSGTDPFTVPDLLQSIQKEEIETLLGEIFQQGRLAMSVVRPCMTNTDEGKEE
jgi:predicted Zn-dependent peptidase